MSTFKKTYLLRQHTPLIHFLPGQQQAFLRGTEVKPRLDAYIIDKVGKHNIPDDWKVGFAFDDDKAALNYKLSFKPVEVLEPFTIEREGKNGRPQQFPAYFANMGEKDKTKHKHFVFAKQDARVTVKSLNAELLGKVAGYLPGFFATHNFMSRKTKGFGSFTMVGKEKQPFGPSTANYSFELQCGNNDIWLEFNRLFERIDLFYRTIRSGINFVRGPQSMLYFKSLLYHYARAQQPAEEWDKKKMKVELFHGGKGPDNARLYRDMLGLASSVDWLDQRAKVEKKGSNTVQDGDKSEEVDIARYPSPITFKPVYLGDGRYRVYILTKPTLKIMENAKFSVITNRGGRTSLMTPAKFDVDGYLRFVARYFQENDFYDYVGNYDNRYRRDVETLNDIFQQLAEQA
jgi:hypothetical protein